MTTPDSKPLGVVEPYPGFIAEAVAVFAAMVANNSAALAEFPEIRLIVAHMKAGPAPPVAEMAYDQGRMQGARAVVSQLQGVDGALADVWRLAGCEDDGCLFKFGVGPQETGPYFFDCACLRRHQLLLALVRLAQVLKGWP